MLSVSLIELCPFELFPALGSTLTTWQVATNGIKPADRSRPHRTGAA
jgi:hypothetical protein